MSIRNTAAVVGAQFGDEGKGKIVDALAPDYDWVVRFQGGNNAGHTLVVDGEKTILHHIPSGILHGDKICAIGPGCVIDPIILVEELEGLHARGIPATERLRLAGNATLILPVHRALDAARELEAGDKKIGTTKRGIGPAYEDRMGRISALVQSLRSKDDFSRAVDRVLPRRNRELRALEADTFSTEEIVERVWPTADMLAPLIHDVSLQLCDAIKKGQAILFEGAQGCLLDRTYGTLPYVTSSHTGLTEIASGAGVPPHTISRSVGIVKAYQTRVGEGPFPTELLDGPVLDHLREVGREYGSTTGRPRRCGWLDLPLLRYVCTTNGFTELAITKLDVLQGVDPIRVCVGYEVDGNRTSIIAPWRDDLAAVKPIFRDFPGFSEDISGIREFGALPENAQNLLLCIEQETETSIRMISVGPGRTENILR